MQGPPPLLNVEYWFRVIYELIVNRKDYSFDQFIAVVANVWQVVTYVSYVVTLGLIAFLVYVILQTREIAKEDEARYATIESKTAKKALGHARWQHVEERIAGLQESDWRQAIIEADIMLDDILRSRGYEGDTLADRLKQLSSSLVPSLDGLWDAHRIRNRIAHEGSAFKLEERVAHRTISQYRNAFTELGIL